MEPLLMLSLTIKKLYKNHNKFKLLNNQKFIWQMEN